RFLHLTDRQVGAIRPPLAQWPQGTEPSFQPVEMLRIGEQRFHSWQEAEERQVLPGEATLDELVVRPLTTPFTFSGGRRLEALDTTSRESAGVLVRREEAVTGTVVASAMEVETGLYRVTVRVENHTPLPESLRDHRDAALLRALVSLHTVAGVRDGEFVSL